jgi:hypothetical protein
MTKEPTYEELKRLVDEQKSAKGKISHINDLFELLGTDPKANIDGLVKSQNV